MSNEAQTTHGGDTSTDSPDTGAVDLLAMAEAADAGQEITVPEAKPRDAKQAGKVADPREEAAKGAPDGADKVSAVAKKDEAPKGEQKKPDAAKSPQDRQVTDDQRKDTSWKALNEEKATVRRVAAEQAERAKALEERERKLAEREQEKAQQREPAKCPKGRTAADYEAIAKQLEEDGEAGAAKAALKQAEQLKAKDAEAATAAKAPAPGQQFDLRAEAAEMMRERPELQNKDNPVVVAGNWLLADPKWSVFLNRPGGVRAAVEVAEFYVKAQRADALEKELAGVKAELEELQKATGLGGSPAVATKPKGGAPTDEDMLRAAQEADGAR